MNRDIDILIGKHVKHAYFNTDKDEINFVTEEGPYVFVTSPKICCYESTLKSVYGLNLILDAEILSIYKEKLSYTTNADDSVDTIVFRYIIITKKGVCNIDVIRHYRDIDCYDCDCVYEFNKLEIEDLIIKSPEFDRNQEYKNKIFARDFDRFIRKAQQCQSNNKQEILRIITKEFDFIEKCIDQHKKHVLEVRKNLLAQVDLYHNESMKQITEFYGKHRVIGGEEDDL